MNKCIFYNEGKAKCEILSGTKCIEKCKFRKTNAEFYEGVKHAEKILKSKGLTPCIVHTLDRGDIMTTMKIK